jgi:ubiquinone/menaquinone biosynthesis C-methylase UbiE
MSHAELIKQVEAFWDRSSCGERLATGPTEREKYEAQGRARFELEPYIPEFAKFAEGAGKDVLEIGVGMGADHLEWARSGPRSLTGIDLTERAIEHTKRRFEVYGLESNLTRGNAEALPFDDETFDLVYSFGVLHHTPDTPGAVREVYRVLRPGGLARIMIYHKYSLTGYMLWARYALLRGRPRTSLADIYHRHLESPGTKAYSVREARAMFSDFSAVDARVQLCWGDLLQGSVGQRHRGPLLAVAKAIWPRFVLKRLFKDHGLFLLIEARK